MASIREIKRKKGTVYRFTVNREDSPKKEKRPVDALTGEQAKEVFRLLGSCPLEWRCIMLLLLTTGMRRGELVGLQWRDVDFDAGTVSINRNVVYTPQTGLVVDTPKTVNSLRTVPLMPSVVSELEELRQEVEEKIVPFPKKRTGKSEKKRSEKIPKSSSRGEEICFKTIRREPAEAGMWTQGVVEVLDVGKHVGLGHGAGGVVREVNQLTFQAAEEIFGHSVVVGVAPAGQRPKPLSSSWP